MKDSINNKHYANLLLGLNEKFGSEPPAQKPDIKALHAAIKAGKIIKNPFHLYAEKPIRQLAPYSSINSPSAQSGKNIYIKKSGYDYRKDDPPLYSKAGQESEDAILKNLDDLLLRAEHEGLDSAELAELSDLQKKVR